jgi:putative sensor protein
VAGSFVRGHAASMTTFAATDARFAPLQGLAQTGKDFLYLVLGLPLGIAAFTFVVTALSLSVGLAITLVGIPLLVLTLLASRWIAKLERVRAGLVVDDPLTTDRPLTGGTIERSKALFRDRSAWAGVAWSVLLLPIGTFGFTVAISLWSTALGFVTSPLWYWAMPDDDETIPLLDSTSLGYTALRVLIGLALLPTTMVACRALAAGTGKAARAILG